MTVAASPRAVGADSAHAALDQLAAVGRRAARDTVVLLNTGSGASYGHDDG